MGSVSQAYFGESRVFVFPLMDLKGLPPNSPQVVTQGQAPLTYPNEGGSWGVYGQSALRGPIQTDGVQNLAPINLEIKNQELAEDWFRAGNQQTWLGAPLEHVAGIAGNPTYATWPRIIDPGTRLIPTVAHQDVTGGTPTGRSPLYVVQHSVLNKERNKSIKIGSRAQQLKKFGGFYTWYSGIFPISSASPLKSLRSMTMVIPINNRKHFFVDSIWVRQCDPVDNGQVQLLNNEFSPLVIEPELLVSYKDTASNQDWIQPQFAPLWTVAGQSPSLPYRPPTCFVVRPNGNIEVTIMNNQQLTGLDEWDSQLEFTFGGTLVDLSKIKNQGQEILLDSNNNPPGVG